MYHAEIQSVIVKQEVDVRQQDVRQEKNVGTTKKIMSYFTCYFFLKYLNYFIEKILKKR